MDEHDMMRRAGNEPADPQFLAVLSVIKAGAENAKMAHVVVKEVNELLDATGNLPIKVDNKTELPTRNIIRDLIIHHDFLICSLTAEHEGLTRKGYFFALTDGEGVQYMEQLDQRIRGTVQRRNKIAEALDRTKEIRKKARDMRDLWPEEEEEG